MPKLGEAFVEVTADTRPLNKGLGNARKLVTNSMRSIARIIKNTAKVAAVAFVGIGVASIKFAADVEESEDLFDISMGGMADSSREWSNQLADDLKLNRFQIRENVATMNLMLKSMGFNEGVAAEMSQTLAELTINMSSIKNQKLDEMFTKLSAGMTGESEPLKRLGTLINDNALKQFLFSRGINRTVKSLSALEKVMVIYGAILNANKDATDNFLITADSTTNVFRSLMEILKETAALLGTELKQSVTDLAARLRDELIANQDKIVAWGEKIGEAMTTVSDAILDFIDTIQNGKGFGAAFSEQMEIIGEAIEAKFPKISALGKTLSFIFGLGEGLVKATPIANYMKIDKLFKMKRGAERIAGERDFIESGHVVPTFTGSPEANRLLRDIKRALEKRNGEM